MIFMSTNMHIYIYIYIYHYVNKDVSYTMNIKFNNFLLKISYNLTFANV